MDHEVEEHGLQKGAWGTDRKTSPNKKEEGEEMDEEEKWKCAGVKRRKVIAMENANEVGEGIVLPIVSGGAKIAR